MRLPSTLCSVFALVRLVLESSPALADVNDRVAFDVPGLVIVWAADADSNAPVALDFVVDTGTGASDTDLIPQDAFTVVTGTLTPTYQSTASTDVASRAFEIYNSPNGNGSTDSNGNGVSDAGDTFSGFQLGQGTDVGLEDSTSRTSFYVASNTPFNIDAQAYRVIGRDDWVLGKIFWDMSVNLSGDDGLPFGSQAQLPNSAGPNGGIGSVDNLLEMKTRQTVFQGDQATARGTGTIAEQSVRFDVVYTLGSWRGYTLSTPGVQMADGIYEVEAEVVYTLWVP